MKHIVFTLFISCGLLVSCHEEKPPIPKEKMADILTELHMAESFAQLLPIDQGGYMTKNYDTMLVLYSNIYAKNNLDTLQFKEAIAWYEARPKEFDEVYERVLETLSIRKENVKDSLVKAKKDSVIEDSVTTKIPTPDTL